MAMMPRSLLFKLYGINSEIIKTFVRMIIWRLEGTGCYSITLRKIFKHYHEVDVGMYSDGGCFVAGQFGKKTTIGRYTSIAMTASSSIRYNLPALPSTHPFFYSSELGYCEKGIEDIIPLNIGHDVWMGYYAIIKPSVRDIGTGAVIAAGSVVDKDVPPYAIVVGNPARLVRYRFPKDVIQKLLASNWWEKDINEIINSDYNSFFGDYLTILKETEQSPE